MHVGFLHEMTIGKNSLAYDLQEPFRFLVDLTVISLIENSTMEKKDFIRTENYTLRLRPSGARKLLNEFNMQLNKKVEYKGKDYSWSYIILLKTRELSHFLIGKKSAIDFNAPSAELLRHDNDEIRQKILSMPYSEWKKTGFSKGTLHYMKKNARSNKPFTLNQHVKKRLENWSKIKVKVS